MHRERKAGGKIERNELKREKVIKRENERERTKERRKERYR